MDFGKEQLILELYRSNLVSGDMVKRYERATNPVARSNRFTMLTLTRSDL